MTSIQSTKTLLLYVSVSVLCGGIISFLAFHKAEKSPGTEGKEGTVKEAGIATMDKDEPAGNNYELVTVKNRKGLELISPLLYSKAVNEAKDLATLKLGVANIIEEGKRSDIITQASIYLVSLTDGSWVSINPDEEYHPGSLIKVPMLMTYLKQATTNPALLDMKIRYEKDVSIPAQTYTSEKLMPGQVYSVKDLLRYMISYSDNNATHVLNQNANVQLFKETFTDLNLPEPNVKDRNFTMNARRYSEFLLVLYNATYLSQKASQYSLELMAESAFKEGMIKGLPKGVKVAHKFGEWGDIKRNIHELHESGIVYAGDKPYLLTVMTRGASPEKLSEEISKISDYVYGIMSARRRAFLLNDVYYNTLKATI